MRNKIGSKENKSKELLLDITVFFGKAVFYGVIFIYCILPPNLNSKFTFKISYKSLYSQYSTAQCLALHKYPFLLTTNSVPGFELNVGDNMDENHRISTNSRKYERSLIPQRNRQTNTECLYPYNYNK